MRPCAGLFIDAAAKLPASSGSPAIDLGAAGEELFDGPWADGDGRRLEESGVRAQMRINVLFWSMRRHRSGCATLDRDQVRGSGIVGTRSRRLKTASDGGGLMLGWVADEEPRERDCGSRQQRCARP